MRCFPLIASDFISNGVNPSIESILILLRVNRITWSASAGLNPLINAENFHLDDDWGGRNIATEAAYNTLKKLLNPKRSLTFTSKEFDQREFLLNEISNDISDIENRSDPVAIAQHGLWRKPPPEKINECWRGLKSLLFENDHKNWYVWTDWYEARVRGDRTDVELELAYFAISQEIWEQGPSVLNKKIHEIITASPNNIRKYVDIESPQPVINYEKLSNDNYDGPEEGRFIAERQISIIDILLSDLNIDKNISRSFISTLERYKKELEGSERNLSLALLNDMYQISRDEYNGLKDEKFFEQQRGLRRSFLLFFSNHKLLRSHFPFDLQREEMFGAVDMGRISSNIPALVDEKTSLPAKPDNRSDIGEIDHSDIIEDEEADEEIKTVAISEVYWAYGILVGVIVLAFTSEPGGISGYQGFLIGLIATIFLLFVAMKWFSRESNE